MFRLASRQAFINVTLPFQCTTINNGVKEYGYHVLKVSMGPRQTKAAYIALWTVLKKTPTSLRHAESLFSRTSTLALS